MASQLIPRLRVGQEGGAGKGSEEALRKRVAEELLAERMRELGEVSFHAGWTFHRAEPNQSDQTRGVFTVIYMDRDMRVREPEHAAQTFDMHVWTPGIAPGETAASAINPILYER